jgi:putative ABC transport system ATP-binding protein
MIRLRAVKRTFAAPGGRAVNAVDLPRLDVDRGTHLRVTGPNGAGKTTLLHMLSGLLRPDSGSIQVDGHELGRFKEHQLDRFRARRVGTLLQRPHLLAGLTAEQNVMAALLFAGCPRGERQPRAAALLEQLGVEHRAHHRPSALSGGERQRVALARALANDPPLLLADEPTASLDRDGAAELLAHLERLVREGGRTLVLVTHRPEEFPGEGPLLRMEPGEAASLEESP